MVKKNRWSFPTYALQISVNYIVVVQIIETLGDPNQLCNAVQSAEVLIINALDTPIPSDRFLDSSSDNVVRPRHPSTEISCTIRITLDPPLQWTRCSGASRACKRLLPCNISMSEAASQPTTRLRLEKTPYLVNFLDGILLVHTK